MRTDVIGEIWWSIPAPNPRAESILYCFPYAGASASMFASWCEKLPPNVELRAVQLPGRANRIKEQPFTEIHRLATNVSEVLRKIERPFAFFGHSVGAAVSFEVARELRRRLYPLPRQLMVSGRRAPHIPFNESPRHLRNNADFIECLRDLKGTPAAVLNNPELLALLLPILRADFELSESYMYAEEPPLPCHITVFGGKEDQESYGGRLDGWKLHGTKTFEKYLLNGDHFFLHSQERQLLRFVSAEILRCGREEQ